VSNLVYGATGDSVRDVFVMGEQVVAGGRLTRIEEAKLFAEVQVAVGRLNKRLKFDQMVQLKWPVQ
jgi:5-methylthioadenosine/S-adenosylhomocysteine deaminase